MVWLALVVIVLFMGRVLLFIVEKKREIKSKLTRQKNTAHKIGEGHGLSGEHGGFFLLENSSESLVEVCCGIFGNPTRNIFYLGNGSGGVFHENWVMEYDWTHSRVFIIDYRLDSKQNNLDYVNGSIQSCKSIISQLINQHGGNSILIGEGLGALWALALSQQLLEIKKVAIVSWVQSVSSFFKLPKWILSLGIVLPFDVRAEEFLKSNSATQIFNIYGSQDGALTEYHKTVRKNLSNDTIEWCEVPGYSQKNLGDAIIESPFVGAFRNWLC